MITGFEAVCDDCEVCDLWEVCDDWDAGVKLGWVEALEPCVDVDVVCEVDDLEAGVKLI